MNDSNEMLIAETEELSEIKEKVITDKITEDIPEFTKAETILSLASIILGFCFIKFTVFNTTGFITTLFFMAVITVSQIYLRKKGFAVKGFNKALLFILYAFTLVFSITANGFIKFLDVLFLIGAGGYFVYSVSAEKTGIERFLPFAFNKAIKEYPFSEFKTQPKVIRYGMGKTSLGNNVKMIFLGLILTVPLTAIVSALLMSADSGMEHMLSSVFRNIFTTDVRTLFWQLLFTFPCSMYLFGMLYSNTHRDNLFPIYEDECEEKLQKARLLPNGVLYTAVTPILILYVMFFISQANYFLSAFRNTLPEGYSYAEYARRGFFELFAISIINLAVILIINIISKNSGKNKPKTLKAYTLILSFFTLILIATAVSKMVMYISEYGLTQLRVYTTWFMILCAVIFIMIIIKQFKPDFHIAKHISVAFTIMFAVLCFSRPDSLITKYNIEMYNAGYLSELDMGEIYSMSDDALVTAVNNGVITSQKAKNRCEGYDAYRKMNISHLFISNK